MSTDDKFALGQAWVSRVTRADEDWVDSLMASAERGNVVVMTTSDSVGYTSTPGRSRPNTRGRFYTLAVDGKTPELEPNAERWQRWMAHSPVRVVKQDVLENGSFVSTVFVGVEGALWQSLVIRADASEEARYYNSFDAAEAGHGALLAAERGTRAIRMRE